jgi:cytochrome c
MPVAPATQRSRTTIGWALICTTFIGRKAGSVPDYDYSSAMRDAGFLWDKEQLERFIADPDELVPGNRMKPYNGLASAADRT